MKADDVLFSFEVAYDEKLHPAVQDLVSIGGKRFEVSAPDSYTIVTRIAKPNANMLGTMSTLRILPRHVMEAPFRRGEFASTYAVSTRPESIVTSGGCWPTGSGRPSMARRLGKPPCVGRLLVTVTASLYPAWFASRTNPADALRVA